ncbi:MAG: hypothetical protein SGI84_07750 [Gemmatimonadota bacterium]|nr:hypothetical protein [Gemmatimonadota bacterium]
MLLAGASIFALILVYLVLFQTGPLLEDGVLVGYLLAAPSLSATVLGVTLLRSRIIARASGQSREEYWADPQAFGRAMGLWMALEQGAILGLVGWLLSGNLFALVAGATAIGTLGYFTPGRVAGQ